MSHSRGPCILLTFALGLVVACASFPLSALAKKTEGAAAYLDNKALASKVKKLARRSDVRAEKLAKSRGGHSIWLLEAGGGDKDSRANRPAMLVVAGIEGNDLAGSTFALAWIERLLDARETDEEIAAMLETTTIYVVPRLNPDAAELYFAEPQSESATNARPFDDDHDGLIDEDGPEDLNGDGRVAWMRVEDPEGKFIRDEADGRLMIEAEPGRGEVGRWRYLREGLDNDADEQWNEDGLGGVNFNRNFPFDYTWFEPDSGLHQVSEPETRALADFIVDHPAISIVFTYGAADNLVKLPKDAKPAEDRTPPEAVQTDDLPYYKHLGEAYRTALGLDKELTGASPSGSFSDWVYFNRGRFSLAASPWSPELAVALEKEKDKDDADAADEDTEKENGEANAGSDSENGDDKKSEDKKKEDEKKGRSKDADYLKWIDTNAPELFIEWEAFDHPDFPGKNVEIGGFAPFAKSNPPQSQMEDLTTRHADFLTSLSLKLPRIAIRSAEVKDLGKGVYELTIQIENTGYLPTALAQGERTREVYPTRVTLDLPDDAFLAGSRTTMLGAIAGSGGMEEIRLVVRPGDTRKAELSVISMLGGTAEVSVEFTP